MKKILPFLFLLSHALSGIAQSVLPNPGFENWVQVGTRMDPVDWNTLNPNTAIVGVLTCLKASGADIHSGNAAIKLVTKLVLGQNANGIATTGTISIAPPGISGGVAYAGRPDSIAGWYKYTSVNSDNGFVEFQLLGTASTPDTIGYVRFTTPTSTVATYTRFSAPIVYRSTNPVAKSIWILSSSAGFTASVNSTLFVDDLELITNSGAGIQEQNLNYLSMAPNPVQDGLVIENTKGTVQFALYDSNGNLALQSSLNPGTNTLNLKNLSNGIYFYTAYTEQLNHLQKGKIILAK